MSRTIKSSNQLADCNAYELIIEEELSELKTLGLLFKHKKTGARVMVMSNEDENKVFSIGFRTPPTDSTGVAHIVEHSVLCGSRKFPSKDPFVELVKGSLNTFLNAMTYPDKTVYPIASCNEKDFQNLMDVYMDAVLYPNIYNKEEIFRQEGWNYKLENKEDELIYNGVVYNEMKGVFSSPDQVLYRFIQQSLFPDNNYGTESGGDPDYITDLTYEEFLNFHKKYYHPSNSYIMLYGNMDIEEKLNWLDGEYLSNFDKLEVDSEIKMQKPFTEIQEMTKEYSIMQGDSLDQKTYLSYNAVIGTSLDPELYLAFQVLDYVLAGSPGAPLKQALLDAGVGKDVLSSYDNNILQPIFSIISKNTDANKKDEFVKIIEDTLRDLVKNGLNEKTLQAAINYYEFRYREADFGQFPKGLMYGLQVMDSWLYRDDLPFIHLEANDTFRFLRESIGTSYYADLIEKYLLNNTHKTIVIIQPKEGLTEEADVRTKEKLAAYKNSLSDQELDLLVEKTAKLLKFQEEPSTQEEIEAIPLLNIEDIKKEARDVFNEEKEIEGVTLVHHNIYTNGIGYLKLLFDVTNIPEERIPYLGLLSTILGMIDTESKSYMDFNNEVNIHTGGLYTDLVLYTKKGRPDDYCVKFQVKLKALYNKFDKGLELSDEMLFHTNFEDEKRLLEVISELKTKLQSKMTSSAHSTAVGRALSYSTKSSYFNDLTTGIAYYDFIADLENNFDQKKGTIINTLKQLAVDIFRKDNLLVSLTADVEGYNKCAQEIKPFITGLSTEPYRGPIAAPLNPTPLNEGFKNSGKVQYVARTGNFIKAGYQYSGALKVLKVILSYDYLWVNVRVKGGAYGCMCGFSMEGNGFLTSYRDPNLRETNEVYENLYDYVKNFEASDRDMTKYIIGAISNMDTPLNPDAIGSRSLLWYISGMTLEESQKDRNEVLSTTTDVIHSLAELCKSIVDTGNICVIGNEAKIDECSDLFKETKNLF